MDDDRQKETIHATMAGSYIKRVRHNMNVLGRDELEIDIEQVIVRNGRSSGLFEGTVVIRADGTELEFELRDGVFHSGG